jgi:hypothetical protein
MIDKDDPIIDQFAKYMVVSDQAPVYFKIGHLHGISVRQRCCNMINNHIMMFPFGSLPLQLNGSYENNIVSKFRLEYGV